MSSNYNNNLLHWKLPYHGQSLLLDQKPTERKTLQLPGCVFIIIIIIIIIKEYF